MKTLKQICATALLALPLAAMAGPGHDHDDAAPASSGAASPRFESQSDLFEAVGMLDSDLMVVTIDRYADNDPVLNAKVEIESGAFKSAANFNAASGTYTVSAAAFQKPGTYPITLTVRAGSDTDLLAGDLLVSDATDSEAEHAHGLNKSLIGVLAGLATLILATGVVFWRRRRRAKATAQTSTPGRAA